MKDNIDNTTQNPDIIDLGVASIETKGPLTSHEDAGGQFPVGISNE